MRASAMLITLLSIVASVFPERYRRRWFQDADLDVKRGAVLSGLAQIFVPGLTLWLRYPAYYNAQLAAAYIAVQGRGGPDHIREGFAGFALGPLTMFQYILTPLNLLLIYWCAEGGIRLMAALATGEVVPTLPLQLVAWAQGLGAVHAREMALGERVPDEVLQLEGKHALAIASCRPKDWDHLITIRYKDELFELAEAKEGTPPRRFVYLLRPSPAHKVVRGLHDYDPEEALKK